MKCPQNGGKTTNNKQTLKPNINRKCRHCGDILEQGDDILCVPCSGGWK
ncbi:hypothetical protein HY485_03600 [Candidatus Woesearchaeota archaeon]|nr:hypothetical protein [Candidatus Woesearchaeota archaeon]